MWHTLNNQNMNRLSNHKLNCKLPIKHKLYLLSDLSISYKKIIAILESNFFYRLTKIFVNKKKA